MEAETSEASLREVAVAYRGSALLLAALELDLFTIVADASGGVEAIVRRFTGDSVAVRLLIDSLVAIGLLEKDSLGRLEVPASISPLVVTGSSYIGSQLLAHRSRLGQWMKIPELIRGDMTGAHLALDVRRHGHARDYLSLVARSNEEHVTQLTEYFGGTLPAPQTILDVGGGHGYYILELLRRYPRARGTILDFRDVLEYCRALHAGAPEADRLRTVEGNLFDHTLEEKFDLVMANDLNHYFGCAAQRSAVDRLWSLVSQNGVMAISKFTLSPSRTEPPESALFSLKVYLDTGGYLASDSEMRELMKAVAGQSPVEARIGSRKTVLHVGRRSEDLLWR